MTSSSGVSLGRLLLALDRTVATLVTAPRGLDVPIGTPAMVDIDDIRYGLGRTVGSADLFLAVGLDDATLRELVSGLGGAHPVAIMAKSPSAELAALTERLGIAMIAVEPHARWERIYNLVIRVLDGARTELTGESMRSGSTGDLFELAGEVARRTGGLVSIEDERSHVLAYSTAGDEADELRRLSILGREGPPEMLAWLRQWGVMDALRTSAEVVTVDERADLGLRRRLAVAIRTPAGTGVTGAGTFLGVVWLQEGRGALSDDAPEVLKGAAAVAARVIARRRAVGTDHDELVRRLLGGRGEVVDAGYLGTQLGIEASTSVTVVAFGVNAVGVTAGGVDEVAGQVSALMLHASAFSPLSVTTLIGARAYVVLPGVGADAAVAWARVAVAATDRQFGVRVRAVISGPAEGLGEVPDLRAHADQVLDAAEREGDLIDDVTTVERSRTGVLLGEIVGMLSANPDLVDPRVAELVRLDEETGSDFTESLRAHLDHFGDVRAAADDLQVHPNTLRYRLRRIQTLTGMDLDDPATRLVVALSLRVR